MRNRGLNKNYKTIRGEYVPVEWNGKNESGWDPTGSMVLVLQDKAAEKSAGGIIKPDEYKEREEMAAECGVIVALGPTAFAWADRERTTRWEGKKPQVGDRVSFQRYSGVHVPGDDEETYSTMNDFCIGAVRSIKPVSIESIVKGANKVVAAITNTAKADRANSRN